MRERRKEEGKGDEYQRMKGKREERKKKTRSTDESQLFKILPKIK